MKNAWDGMIDLIGRKILGIEVEADGQHFLRFRTDGGDVTYFAEGDCCSESWFADILGVEALIGGTVTATEEIELPDYNVDDGRGRQESDEVYGYKIVTDKGMATVAFRNSSNGYYGGSLNVCEPGDAEFDGWTAITEDWGA